MDTETKSLQNSGLLKFIFFCLDDMIRMKKAAGRTKDLEDLKYLKKIKAKKK